MQGINRPFWIKINEENKEIKEYKEYKKEHKNKWKKSARNTHKKEEIKQIKKKCIQKHDPPQNFHVELPHCFWKSHLPRRRRDDFGHAAPCFGTIKTNRFPELSLPKIMDADSTPILGQSPERIKWNKGKESSHNGPPLRWRPWMGKRGESFVGSCWFYFVLILGTLMFWWLRSR